MKKENAIVKVILFLLVFVFVNGVLLLNFNNVNVEAEESKNVYDEIQNIENNSLTDEKTYLSVHYTDGTMGMIVEEDVDYEESEVMSISNDEYDKTTILSSGKPDNQSLVVVFLSEGFIESEMDLFIQKVEEIANYMKTVEPFNYYKDYLTVYAVKCISNESGVSGELDGTFACHNSSKEPATSFCTPNNGLFLCGHGKDTYFKSYYAWRTLEERVLIEMSSSDRGRARTIAKKISSSVDMIQVLANSGMYSGTGEYSTTSEPLGVALTSINSASSISTWKDLAMHEFGHSFGGLTDEYWNENPVEAPNMTKTSNPDEVRWSKWIGCDGVGVYPFSSTEADDNKSQETKLWYRPHQECKMRENINSFCPVCQEELLKKLADATGIQLFDTTYIGENEIRIDKLNLEVTGSFIIPDYIEGRTVTVIGEGAFAEQELLEKIIMPNTITEIESNAFKNCIKLNNDEFESIRFSSALTIIGTSAFENCSALNVIILPDGVSAVGDAAFKGCINLEEVLIPASVTDIGNSIFENCSKLYNVKIEKEVGNIPSFGVNIFNGCNALESIKVKQNLLLDYKNEPNLVSVKDKIITPYLNIPKHDINCRTDVTKNESLEAGYNKVYQLDVDCSKTYVLDILSELPLNASVYDSNMSLMNLNFTFSSDYKEGHLETYLSKGIYYIKINSSNIDVDGEVQLNINPKWETYPESVDIGENNILTHLHTDGNIKINKLYFNNQIGLGFYKFKLTAIKTDGTEVEYDASSIVIKDADNLEVIKRYNSNNVNIFAENSEDINNMYIFFDRTGYYYIDITLKGKDNNLEEQDYQSVVLSISESSVKEIDVIGRYNQIFTEELISTYAIGDTALKFTINQPSSYEIVIDPVSTSMEDVTLVLFRLVYDKNIGEYYIDEKIASQLPLNDRLLSLEAGNYYMCCFNKKTNQKLTISINRLINSLGITEQVLVCDIDESLPYGTEVRHNGGELGENTITVGFTRHLHFKNIDGVPSLSRYDYDYSYGGKTKSEIIDVSEFGTIYAKKPGTEIVTATYKENRAVIFTIEITVVSNESMENLVIESSRSYSLSSATDIKNGKYCLELTEYNSPYPWIQYYYWEISTEDDIIVTIDQFGRITASGPGTVVLEGTYSKNNKVTLRITITITE